MAETNYLTKPDPYVIRPELLWQWYEFKPEEVGLHATLFTMNASHGRGRIKRVTLMDHKSWSEGKDYDSEGVPANYQQFEEVTGLCLVYLQHSSEYPIFRVRHNLTTGRITLQFRERERVVKRCHDKPFVNGKVDLYG